MTAPAPDSTVRLRLKCSDAEDFVERFAPNVTRGGIFLPTREAREVGASIRFELTLLDEEVVFAGEGVVTWAKPKGMGVKFTNLDPATAPMLERLLIRRQAAPPARESPAVAQASPAPPPELAEGKAGAAPSGSSPVAEPTPVADPATGPSSTSASFPEGAKRSLFRPSFALAAVFAAAAVVVVSVSVGRARLGTQSSGELAKPAAVATAPAPAAAPAVQIAAPPPVAAPEPPNATPSTPPVATRPTSAAAQPSSSARPGSVHVESMVVGASYKGFTCPNPTSRLSVKSSKTVNVCLHVAHRPGKVERLTLIWERNGAFSGKTPLEIPASRPNIRTRARMKISQKRLGSWSVRLVSDRNAPLAQTTFDVVP